MKKGFIFVVIYILFVLFFNIYNSNKKYLILNNDYVFDITNEIKIVKEFPSYLNNTKIKYFDDNSEKEGYIKINKKRQQIDDENGNNIDIYTKDYNLIISDNLIATSNIKQLKTIDIKSIEEKTASTDSDIVQDYLSEKNKNFDKVNYYRKYTLDLNNDNKQEKLFILSNIDDSEFSSSNSIFEYVFINDGESNNTLYSMENGGIIYYLNNIFDLENDNNYEINFSIENNNDPYYHCESIFKLKDNYKEYKNCNMEEN